MWTNCGGLDVCCEDTVEVRPRHEPARPCGDPMMRARVVNAQPCPLDSNQVRIPYYKVTYQINLLNRLDCEFLKPAQPQCHALRRALPLTLAQLFEGRV
jgi:hypothetical protein